MIKRVVHAFTRHRAPGTGHGSAATLHRWRCLPELLRLLWELGAREMVLIASFGVLAGTLPVAQLAVLRGLVDSAVGVARGMVPTRVALLWLGGLLLAYLVNQTFNFFTNRWMGIGDNLRERLKARLQERLLAKAGRLSLATFEKPEFFDQLHRAQKSLDTRLFEATDYLFITPSLLVSVITLLLYVGAASPFFPLILLAGFLPLHILGARQRRQRYVMDRSHTERERRVAYLDDLMTGREAAAELRLFGLGEHLVERRQALFRSMRDDRLELARRFVRRAVPVSIVEQLTYGMVVVGTVALVARGRLSVGYFAAYLGAAERFRDSLMFLMLCVSTLDSELRYVQDLLDYLKLPEEEPRSAHDVPPSPVIRFEGVTFTYPGAERPVLEALDLTLRPGERVALVGDNGAGKTTLARLLLGLYTPTAGRITVDGTDMSEIDPAAWRSRAAAVFQDYVRYALTARENIGFGDPSRLEDMAAIRAAAARGGADAVIETLPAGYETILGKAYDDAGHDLSLGQWQKLAIARAVLRDASLLVLDEPTAALDARAEVGVYRQFRDMAVGKTVLLISHRLGSARLADRIIVLEGGRIVEEGAHAELMARGGPYAERVAVQSAWYR